MKRIFITVFLLTILGMVIIYIENKPDFTGKYESYKQALNDKSSNGSWVPDFLPKSAHNIGIEYSLSPAIYRLEFEYEESDEQSLLTFFHSVEQNESEFTLAQMQDHWLRPWIQKVSENVIVLKSENIDPTQSKTMFIAIDVNSNYFWCESLWE